MPATTNERPGRPKTFSLSQYWERTGVRAVVRACVSVVTRGHRVIPLADNSDPSTALGMTCQRQDDVSHA
jgi:hypothetical protein